MANTRQDFPEQRYDVDVCVVGGGMAGVCAAMAAARGGARTVLMHERPVLGGNASSEMRMHICGADRGGQFPHLRETGILEELQMENLARNPHASYSLWDAVLYDKTRYQPGLTLLLNCSCLDARTEGDRLQSVRGWQLTTQIYHGVAARIFLDCSGDGILAPLSGAAWRMGREARAEYGEPIAPETADARTMGMTCLFQAREYDTPQPFTPPPWANVYEREDDLPYGARGHGWWRMGYWWVELGGEHHSIHDTEMLRDELLKIVFGVWDHIKNRGNHGADNWALEWVQFLPAKRESRRYVGDHVLTQGDIEGEGRFEDVVAYGGWSMDDHHPAGFRAAKLGHPATIFHPAPSPYGIPYRALYSRNVTNLMFAGRCASCTHAAMSSTRVIGTACSMGQAAGTAAAMAVRLSVDPRGIGAHIGALQQALLRDDCYLPWQRRALSPPAREARLTASQGDPEPVRDGVARQVGNDPHCWTAAPGDWIEYAFARRSPVKEATLIVDSAMDKRLGISRHAGRVRPLTELPDVMPRAFVLEGRRGGAWEVLARIDDNHQRLVRLAVNRDLDALRWTLTATRGAARSRVYAFYVE